MRGGRSPCDHYPCCIKTWVLPSNPQDPRHGAYPSSITDIWWSSLETSLNVFTWGRTPSPAGTDIYWWSLKDLQLVSGWYALYWNGNAVLFCIVVIVFVENDQMWLVIFVDTETVRNSNLFLVLTTKIQATRRHCIRMPSAYLSTVRSTGKQVWTCLEGDFCVVRSRKGLGPCMSSPEQTDIHNWKHNLSATSASVLEAFSK